MTSDSQREYWFLRRAAGVLDLSSRGRLCLTGADRQRFLNGQVTNNVKDLAVGQGCYAALVTAKGKLESDLNVYCLPDELLLDFEEGLTFKVKDRLERYVIADDVQIVDVSSLYGMLTVQGPRSADVVAALGLAAPLNGMAWTRKTDAGQGEIYCMCKDRGPGDGFDLFIPAALMAEAERQLVAAATAAGGGLAAIAALEIARVEAGIPRFGVDMDESNLAPEAIEASAISYAKGCYIGQEVISRIRAYGQVAKSLRGLRLPGDLAALPASGDRIFHENKDVGYVTSAVRSPRFEANLALGYVRREHNSPNTTVEVRSAGRNYAATVCLLPFGKD